MDEDFTPIEVDDDILLQETGDAPADDIGGHFDDNGDGDASD